MSRPSRLRSWFASRFASWLFTSREQATKSKPKRSARLGVEALEDRTVPSAVLAAGVLTITGDNMVDLRIDPINPALLDVFENKVVTDTATPPDYVFPFA